MLEFTINLKNLTSLKSVLLCLMLFSTVLLGGPYHLTGGYGTQTKGGLNGRVIKVTNLESDGPGSLKAACEASGERLVVFEVAGVIDLDKSVIDITDPHITIAGQTAPSPGITIIRGGILVRTHDVVIQHIASRPGEAGEAKGSGWEIDGISAYGTEAYNIVFDHCSVTWATDENMSVSGPPDSAPGESSHDVTFYSCLIAEALSNSTHSEGEHSKGTLLLEGVTNVSIIECLYAHNKRRNPFLKGNSHTVFVNNLIYNPGTQCIGMADRGKSPYVGRSYASIVGNIWMTGPSSTRETFVASVEDRECASVYFKDNLFEDRSGNNMQLTIADVFIKQLNSAPFWPEGLEAKPASESITNVLRSAGARAKERDPIDQRIVQTVIDAEGKIINSEQEVGGYPVYDTVYQYIDVPSTETERQDWLDSLAINLETDSTLDLSSLNLTSVDTKDSMTNENYVIHDSFDLKLRNYPNPFNPTTYFEYTLIHAVPVTLRIFNVLGQAVAMLVNEYQGPGQYQTMWNAENNNSGLYFCHLKAGDKSEVLKLVLLQ